MESDNETKNEKRKEIEDDVINESSTKRLCIGGTMAASHDTALEIACASSFHPDSSTAAAIATSTTTTVVVDEPNTVTTTQMAQVSEDNQITQSTAHKSQSDPDTEKSSEEDQLHREDKISCSDEADERTEAAVDNSLQPTLDMISQAFTAESEVSSTQNIYDELELPVVSVADSMSESKPILGLNTISELTCDSLLPDQSEGKDTGELSQLSEEEVQLNAPVEQEVIAMDLNKTCIDDTIIDTSLSQKQISQQPDEVDLQTSADESDGKVQVENISAELEKTEIAQIVEPAVDITLDTITSTHPIKEDNCNQEETTENIQQKCADDAESDRINEGELCIPDISAEREQQSFEVQGITSNSEDIKDPLPASDNSQYPSFSTSEILEVESSTTEQESSTTEQSTLSTLAESLKKAVSAETPFAEVTSTPASTGDSESAEEFKKIEPCLMDIDTPAESLTGTPYESGETSPSASTPADSCQVSAAPSPLQKDYRAAALPEIEDERFKDTSLNDSLYMKDDDDDDEEIPHRRKVTKVPRITRMPTRSSKQKDPVVLDEDTRMSANGIDKIITEDLPPDEDSESSITTAAKKKVRTFRCEVIVPESTEVFTVDKVVEYIWPLDGTGDHYFIQEHIAQYLGITSFKRKYRDLKRRAIESQEKELLKDMGLVSEMACDLGLTAVRSEDMLDILFNDFPAKYEELQKILRERKEKQLKEKGKVDYQVAKLDKSKMQEYSRKASLNASKWNHAFNKDRKEERRYVFDLQTFTLHYPVRNRKVINETSRMGSYPIAVLPGQYTDYYKRNGCEELKCLPLQTVLSGPYTAEELVELQGMESDEESAPASVATYTDPKEEIASLENEPAVPVVVDPMSAEKQPRCKDCNGGRDRNKDGKPEPLIICGTCRVASHLTCIDLTLGMIDKIESYCWQCMDCKTCAQCNDPDDEEKMIFCDMCDRGYHIYCVGLRRVPNGRWHCKECAVCFTCGARTPSGNEHIKNAEWQHEFRKEKENKQLKYTCTLCVPCDKYWKRRQFCHVCMKVYRSIPEDGMVRCAGCPKYVHKEGCSVTVDGEKHCNICYKNRNNTAMNHSRIIAAAKKKMASSF